MLTTIIAHHDEWRWKEPLRHTLIRLRKEKPNLFGNRPIPLREEDIRRDETFMAILAQEVRNFSQPSAGIFFFAKRIF